MANKRYYDGQEVRVGDRVRYINDTGVVMGPLDAKELPENQVRMMWDDGEQEPPRFYVRNLTLIRRIK